MRQNNKPNRYSEIAIRGPGQILSFELADDIDLNTPVGEFFHRGDIQIVFGSVTKEGTKVVVMAKNFKVTSINLGK